MCVWGQSLGEAVCEGGGDQQGLGELCVREAVVRRVWGGCV